MSFNISNFKTNIEDFGCLKTNKFKLLVLPPPILRNSFLSSNRGDTSYISDISDMLSFRIESVRAPTITILNYDTYRYGVGTTSKVPITAAFNEMYISIISDGYGDIWQFWHNWFKNVFDFTSTDSSRVSSISNQPATYTARYRSEYASTMQLVIYNDLGEDVQRINIYEAFPSSFGEPILSWSDNNNLLKFQISIAYTEYTLDNSDIEKTNTLQQNTNLNRSSVILSAS